MNTATLYLGSLNYVIILMWSIHLASSLYTGSSLRRIEDHSTIHVFVDCDKGNDSSNCGNAENFPCRTLQFAAYKSAQSTNSSHVTIFIAPGVCNENDVLKLDCSEDTVKSWYFVGFNQTSRPPTVIEISAIIRGCFITFSFLHWKNSNGFISMNALTSDVKFENSLLQDSYIQFTGLNTNLAIFNTSVSNCTSGERDIPLFLLQTMYSYQASLFIDNSTFSNNPTPILYATQLHDISVENTIYLKNGQTTPTNGSLITISALSILLRDLKFNQSSQTPIKVLDVTINLTARNLVFSFNNGSKGSCLFINRHSNISLMNSFFESNTNPVIYIEDKDDVNILVKKCHFNCNLHDKHRNPPFIQAPDGTSIVFVNCSKKQSCFVHCKSGELLKSQLFCQKCPAGSFSFNQKNNISSSTCQSCPVGTYTSTNGSSKCIVCSEGTYAKSLGSKACKKCSNEFFTSHTGAQSCSEITFEFILALAVSIPLVIIPITILICRHMADRKSKERPITSGKQYRKLIVNIDK